MYHILTEVFRQYALGILSDNVAYVKEVHKLLNI